MSTRLDACLLYVLTYSRFLHACSDQIPYGLMSLYVSYPRLPYLHYIWKSKLQKLLHKKKLFLFREVFRTHGWSFHAQNIKANRVELFSQQDAIIDLGMGYKYASVIVKLNTFFIYTHFIIIDTNLTRTR